MKKIVFSVCLLALLFGVLNMPQICLAGRLVYVNNATCEQLQSLPGVGEKTAKKILEYRKEHRFSSKEELLKIKGIGKSKFQKIKDKISIE